MRVQWFEWEEPLETAAAIRAWIDEEIPAIDVGPIEREVREEGDMALMRLTKRFDATERPPHTLRMDAASFSGALASIDPELRVALELAAENVEAVARAQINYGLNELEMAQGQKVKLERIVVWSAGIYAPGGDAAYPSSVLMGCIPARTVGVSDIYLATPPRPDGSIDPIVLAAAELCDVSAVYPVGGAQAIFALAYGTESVRPVSVIAGPGNRWVTQAKRAVFGQVGIDSLAGPSELMVAVDRETDPEWVALDLCAQAEHGKGGLLVAAAREKDVLAGIAAAVDRIASERPGVSEIDLALVHLPSMAASPIDVANALAPEHVQLFSAEAIAGADTIQTAGCIFIGPYSATAFGDYIAGSNHILPTGRAGRFSGPLSPDVFLRPRSIVEVPPEAAAKLAPHVKALAEAEGFPVHGESAMIRARR